MDINIGILQLDCRDTVKENLDNLNEHVKLACNVDTSIAPNILILPEYWLTGFNKERMDRYFNKDGERRTLDELRALSMKYQVSIIGSIPHQYQSRKYNAIPWIIYDEKNENAIATDKINWYPKSVLFEALGEKSILQITPGKEVENDSNFGYKPLNDIKIHESNLRVGVSICGELRYPDQFFAYVKNGCQLLINCSQWRGPQVGFDKNIWKSHPHHWEILLKARAVETQLVIVGANRVGRESNYDYEGESMLVNAAGTREMPSLTLNVPDSRKDEEIQLYKDVKINPPIDIDIDTPPPEEGSSKLKTRQDLSKYWENLYVKPINISAEIDIEHFRIDQHTEKVKNLEDLKIRVDKVLKKQTEKRSTIVILGSVVVIGTLLFLLARLLPSEMEYWIDLTTGASIELFGSLIIFLALVYVANTKFDKWLKRILFVVVIVSIILSGSYYPTVPFFSSWLSNLGIGAKNQFVGRFLLALGTDLAVTLLIYYAVEKVVQNAEVLEKELKSIRILIDNVLDNG